MLAIEDAFKLAKESLDSVIRTGSYTLGFAVDIAMAAAQRQLNTFRIIDELAALEGSGQRGSTTRPPEMFKRKHLRGYWHKHHSQSCYIPINLLNEMIRDRTVERLLSPHAGEPLTKELLNKLSNALVHENYMRRLREARLTGEWIVFAKCHDANNYLTLAHHLEGDAIIAERIKRYKALDIQSNWTSREPLTLTRYDVNGRHETSGK